MRSTFNACLFYFRCAVLDELGDTSPLETRTKYFNEWDVDDSGAVDFEEYISVCVLFPKIWLDRMKTANYRNVHNMFTYVLCMIDLVIK